MSRLASQQTKPVGHRPGLPTPISAVPVAALNSSWVPAWVLDRSWCPIGTAPSRKAAPLSAKTARSRTNQTTMHSHFYGYIVSAFGPLASRCCFSQQPSTKDNPQVHHGVDGQLQANTYLPAHGKPSGCAGGVASALPSSMDSYSTSPTAPITASGCLHLDP